VAKTTARRERHNHDLDSRSDRTCLLSAPCLSDKAPLSDHLVRANEQVAGDGGRARSQSAKTHILLPRDVHKPWYGLGMKTRAKPIDGYLDGDLHLIMMAVQKLVDEILPPDEMGCQDHTPAILGEAPSLWRRDDPDAAAAAPPRLRERGTARVSAGGAGDRETGKPRAEAVLLDRPTRARAVVRAAKSCPPYPPHSSAATAQFCGSG
jgi:hypothetical protein